MNIRRIISVVIKYFGVKKYLIKRSRKKASMKLQTVGEEALSAYYDVAKNLSINFSPMFGTLLGIYRDHNFISYDDDIDMILDIKSLSIDLLNELKNKGFEINKIYVASNYKGCQLPMKFKGLTCDIYFSYIDANSRSHVFLPLAIPGYNWSFSCDLNFFRIKDVVVPYNNTSMNWKFRNSQVEIPSNTEEIPTALYGDDFMTPKKNAHADPCMRQIPLYECNYRCFPIDFCLESKIWNGIISAGRDFR